jgi:pimeloyl-ACP methyl ester carboxylesterase
MPTLGIAPLLDAYFRRRFAAAGLVEASVPLDGGATTVHCWRFQPGAVDARPILVLLHGFGPPATWQWRLQVVPLSRRFRLIVPDLLFFGGSSTSAGARVSEAQQAEAVAKLVAAVAPAPARVSVAGTSYGGFVAYHVARLLGPGAVDRVVIASSDLLKADADDRALLRRGGAERVEDVMLPRSPERMRRLLQLAYHRPRRFTPAFVLRDLVQVKNATPLAIGSFLHSVDPARRRRSSSRAVRLAARWRSCMTWSPRHARDHATSHARDVAGGPGLGSCSEAKLPPRARLSASHRRFPNRRVGSPSTPNGSGLFLADSLASPNRFSGTAALPINPERPGLEPPDSLHLQVTDRCTRVAACLPTCIPTNDSHRLREASRVPAIFVPHRPCLVDADGNLVLVRQNHFDGCHAPSVACVSATHLYMFP